jgi:hypothetical protein
MRFRKRRSKEEWVEEFSDVAEAAIRSGMLSMPQCAAPPSRINVPPVR